MAEVAEGVLSVGLTPEYQVVVNHPDLKADERGAGHIIFSPDQAKALGNLLLGKAAEAEVDHAAAVQALVREKGPAGAIAFPELPVRHHGPAPKHPFEVAITIGGDDWDYVLRTMEDLTVHLLDHGPDCKMCSGGAGGCHQVNVAQRNISAVEYHDELSRWAGYR
jgi:hypothetical protein